MNIALALNSDKIEGANFEMNTELRDEFWDMMENTTLDSEERIDSLNVTSLYTNVPLNEAIDIAFKKLTSLCERLTCQKVQ